MEAARNLVAVVVELAAGVKHRQHDFGRRLAARVLIDRNAAAVVDDGDRTVDVNRDVDLVAEARQRLVDRVVDDFVDEMVQAGRPGRADVHRRPLADGLEAFENLDLVGGILGDVRGDAMAVVAGRRRRPSAAARFGWFVSVGSFHVSYVAAAAVRLRSRLVPVAAILLSCSDPHRHDDVGVVVAFGADRPHHRLADFVLQLERDDVGRDRGEKIEHILRVETDLHRLRRSSRPAASPCASPSSGLLDVTSTLPLSIWNFTARDRSFDSSATRFTAFVSRSRSNSMCLSLPFGITRS